MSEVLCGLVPSQIEKLKETHGALFIVEITDGDKVHKAVFREPDMKILKATREVSKTDDLQASIILYENCLIAADEAIVKRDVLKLKVIESIGERMNDLTKTVKNL